MRDEFAVHLYEHCNDGFTSAAALYEELCILGYRGSYRFVRDYFDRCAPSALHRSRS